MSTLPQIGDIRFGGAGVKVFFMAICKECDMALPFPTEGSRDIWGGAHPHVVDFAVDVRPAPGTTPVMRGSSACSKN